MVIDVILSGCAIIHNDELLLLKQFKNDYYEFPGGKVNSGEDMETTAIRESKEEIGCVVRLIKKFGVYKFFHKEKDKNVESNVYLADIISGTPKIMETEIFSDKIWMPLSEYKSIKLAPNVLMFVEEYIRSR